jgi:hypoxanthine phosphoribosyltransferase
MRIEPLFSEAQVETRIRELAARIYRDYADSPLVLLCIADGALRFVDALLAELEQRGVSPERMIVRAQRTRGTDLCSVWVDDFESERLEDRDVLVVDDIADEGVTLRAVLGLVSMGEPRSIRTAVLVDKREHRTQPLALDYVGFEVESGWVVGYGMDLDGEYREMNWIGVLRNDRF